MLGLPGRVFEPELDLGQPECLQFGGRHRGMLLQGDSGGLRLGWVDLDLGSSPAGGRYCSYLLPKQDGGTPQI